RSIVSFGADFVETWQSPVEYARGLSAGRGRPGEARTRFTWVGPRLSTSAVASDLWLRVPPGGEREVALLLLNAIEPVKEFDAAAAHERSGVAPRQIARLAQELRDRRPSALLGPGAQSNADDAVELAEALLRLNFALGNVGHTVLYSQKPTED